MPAIPSMNMAIIYPGMSNHVQEARRFVLVWGKYALSPILATAPDGMKLLLPRNEELPAVGVVPTVGVEPGAAVGVMTGVLVGVGDGCRVGVGAGGVAATVGLGTGVEPDAVGNAPGPLVEVTVAVKPGGRAGDVGVTFFPKGPGEKVTDKPMIFPVATSRIMTRCCPAVQMLSLRVTEKAPCPSA
jgi:hypothetical protein